MTYPSRNLYNSCLRLLLQCCLYIFVYLFTIFLSWFFYFCLLAYHFLYGFFTFVYLFTIFFALVFVVILRSKVIRKQVRCFVFVAFYFNVKRYKSKTPVS